MKNLILSLFVLTGMTIRAQQAPLQAVLIDSSMSWYHESMGSFEQFYFGLPLVKASPHAIHIRFSWEGFMLDIVSPDRIHYQGSLVKYVTAQRPIENQIRIDHEPWKIYFLQESIPEQICKSLADSIVKSKQHLVPHDQLTKNWKYGFKYCYSIRAQFMIDTIYTEQHIYCPFDQDDSLAFKKTILANLDFISEKLALDPMVDKHLAENLPMGLNYNIRQGLGLRKFEKEENKIWKLDKRQNKILEKGEPIMEYLASSKEIIDRHLWRTLASISFEEGFFRSQCAFLIVFNKKGRIKHLKLHDAFRPYFSLPTESHAQEIKAIQSIEKELKMKLIQLNLSQFRLKYPIGRTLFFDEKGTCFWVDRTPYTSFGFFP